MTRPGSWFSLRARPEIIAAFERGCIPLILVGALFAGCPANHKSVGTPAAAFRAAQAAIEAGEYDVAWNGMSAACRRSWIDGTDRQKAGLRTAGPNYAEFERFIAAQYGISGKRFLSTSARELYDLFLEFNGKQILGYEIAGEARIEGKTAYLPVKTPENAQPKDWRYVKDQDRWLLDEGRGQPPKGR